MSLSNNQIQKLIKVKNGDIESAINSVERELLKDEDEFDKAKVNFYFGRLQQLYVEFQALLSNQSIL